MHIDEYFDWTIKGSGDKKAELTSHGKIKTSRGEMYNLKHVTFRFNTPLGVKETKLDMNSLRELLDQNLVAKM